MTTFVIWALYATYYNILKQREWAIKPLADKDSVLFAIFLL